jgi:hypothetical protein
MIYVASLLVINQPIDLVEIYRRILEHRRKNLEWYIIFFKQ